MPETGSLRDRITTSTRCVAVVVEGAAACCTSENATPGLAGRRGARAAAACRRGRRWPRRARFSSSKSNSARDEIATTSLSSRVDRPWRYFTNWLSWMIGSSTASTISITTPPMRDDQQRLEDGGQLHARGAALRRRAGAAARSQHQRQLAGLLAEAREHRQQAGEALLAGQRRGERRAFAHLHQRVHRVGAHRAVATAFRRPPAAPSGSARRRRPASPACRRSAPRCSRARAGRSAAGRASRRRSARGRPRCAAPCAQPTPPATMAQQQQPAPVAHEGADAPASPTVSNGSARLVLANTWPPAARRR